jgi:hypothetical protein
MNWDCESIQIGAPARSDKAQNVATSLVQGRCRALTKEHL